MFQSAQIWIHHTNGLAGQAIARELNLPALSVAYELRRLKEVNGDITSKRLYCGRKLLMSPSKVLRAKRSINSGLTPTAAACQRLHFLTIDCQRVGEALCRIGLKGRRRKKRPLLSRLHWWKWMKWYRRYADYTSDNWASVIFSDETM